MNKLKYLTLLLLLSVVACVRAQADPAAGDVGEVIVLNKADFLTKVFNYEKNPSKWTYEGDKPCIIDFYADWCGPCRRVAPVLQDLANQFKIDYVCPKCGTFLGEIPWESLAKKKRCPTNGCRAKWVNDNKP